MALTIGLVCSPGVGPTRGGRSDNADNYLVAAHGSVVWRAKDREVVEHRAGTGALMAVFRGLGDAPEVAGVASAQVLAKLFESAVPKDPAKALRRFVLDAHEQLAGRARDCYKHPVGASVAACWVVGSTAAWVSVGSCRVYLFRDQRIMRLSTDHTAGELANRDGRPKPKRPDDLAQAFIVGSLLQADPALRIDKGIDSGAEPLVPEDRVLLCTPGIHGFVDDSSLADVLQNVPEPQAAAVACMERSLARGSIDNVTAVVARFGA